jgi:putative colanic acid biosynthesis UDP-glucose lipid carrier transferase
VALNERFAATVDDYLARHCVKPGITGWAQVNGLRGETDTAVKMELRIEYDLYYIKNWSVLFDLKILFRTFRVFNDENAY